MGTENDEVHLPFQEEILVSVVIPTYNEEKYIKYIVEYLIENDEVKKEFFICDAGSTDRTVEIIHLLQETYKNVFYVKNEAKFVPHAFNKAYHLARGKYIALIGAHSSYPKSFFSNGVKYLESGECDVVGGPLIQVGRSESGVAIAYAMSTKFGVGNTEFRTERKKMYVDSVAFAIYKKEIFEKIGLLDEHLKRNQDDELHYRINANGYRILMVPEMKSTYFVRESIPKLFKQYYEYGLYKPYVFKKIKSSIRLRHIIPSLFVLYLISIPLAVLFPLWIVPFILYLSISIYFAFKNKNKMKIKALSFISFFTLHLSYGSGFILGKLRILTNYSDE